MHRRALLLSAACAAVSACAAAPAELPPPTLPRPTPTPMPILTPGADPFDVALYRAIAAEAGNQFISPYSVSCAFALLYPGARGTTAGEIAHTIGFSPDVAAATAQSRATAEAIASQNGGSELSIGNAAWVERTMALRPEYARALQEGLGATIEAVPFVANQAAALRTINAWASRETRGRIPTILTQPDPARRLVLTNAVYFKGKWSHQFSANATRDGDFFAQSGATERARLMRKITHTRYVDGEGFQAAEFDYDDGAFALAVFLPRERNGLPRFEAHLAGNRLDRWLQDLSAAETARLDVTLPKVEMDAEYDLGAPLQALGIRQAFTTAADLSGITEQASLAVSGVVQKTFLAIDEEGTEAAAVTAIDVMVTSAPVQQEPPIEFKADHPFFIVLHHKPTRTRLFMGRISSVA